jgi:tetratricopeptide (TPR) repeat protein
LGDPATLLDVLLRRCQAIWTRDTIEELIAATGEARELADHLEDRVGRFWALFFRGALEVQMDDLSEVIDCHEELDRLAADVGQPILEWAALFNRSWSTLLLGDMAQADALATQALQIGNDMQQPDALPIYGVQLWNIRWYQGRVHEIADMFIQIASDNPSLPGFRAGAAWTLVEVGREDEARDMLVAEKAAGFPALDDFLLLSYLDLWARVISRLGEQDAAKTVYERLSPWPNLIVFAGAALSGAVAHDLGILATILGRYDDADFHFTNALKLDEKLRAPFFVAETKLEWGRMLLARRAPGDLARAQEMLTSACETAQSYGFVAVERRAGEALATLSC